MAQTEVYQVHVDNLNLREQSAILIEGEAHHLQRVRRVKPGELIYLIDGKGNAWKAEYVSGSKNVATCKLLESYPSWNEPKVKIHLGLGVLKSDHFFEAINLTTQAGVCEITPLVCRHSIAGFSATKTERANRISIKAAKQTGRGLIPPVNDMQRLDEWCIKMKMNSRKYFLDADGETSETVREGDNIALAVGPEGGFHLDEVETLKASGFKPISLGYRRLRAETAAVLGVGMLSIPLEI